MNRDTLEQNQIPIYFVAVIAAAIGGLMAPSAAQGLNALVTPTIAALMYAMFLQYSVSWTHGWSRLTKSD